MEIKNIITPGYFTLDEAAMLPDFVRNNIESYIEEQSFENLLKEQTKDCCKIFSREFTQLIKIEKVEYAKNSQGKKNGYESYFTLWVTAIVELRENEIRRISFDLLDSLWIQCDKPMCSHHIHSII